MGVWKVDEDCCADTGTIMAGDRGAPMATSAVYEDWPYRLFDPTHGRDKEEREVVLAEIRTRPASTTTSVPDLDEDEYKKTRLGEYFTEVEAWEAAHEPSARWS